MAEEQPKNEKKIPTIRKSRKVQKARKKKPEQPKNEKKKSGADFGLNPKQSRFCELYASAEEFFGNGTKSYMEVYKCTYTTAQANAADLLANTNICAYINSLIELSGFNDENVDKQLNMLINQHGDPRVKVAAIKEYNVLKQRITKKVELGATDELKEWMEKMNKILDGK